MIINNLSIHAERMPFSVIIGEGYKSEKTFGSSFTSRVGRKGVSKQGVMLYSIVDTYAFDYVSRNQYSLGLLNGGGIRLLQRNCQSKDKPDFVGRLLHYYYKDNSEMLKLLNKRYRVAHHENCSRLDNSCENVSVLPDRGVHVQIHDEIKEKVKAGSGEYFVGKDLDNLYEFDWLCNKKGLDESCEVDLLWSNMVEVYELIQERGLFGGICEGGVGGIILNNTFLNEDYRCLSLQQIKDRVVYTAEFCYRYEPMSLYAEDE